ncbi:MAG: sigma-70 family RNA polymerase sigma factor [Flavobacteriales bacterium]|nr:sigma-70 family RNA polymerase sigma factor [Flavobacteriales bacterium]
MEDNIYINQVLDGNTDQFAVLVERYKDFAYTIALRITKNVEDAEEVAQDAFLKAFQQLENFHGSAKFSTWLYTIVFRTAISKTRKKGLETYDVEEHVVENAYYSNETPLDELSKVDQRNYVRAAIDRLSEMDGLIISLYYIEESTISEIEEITGWSESNVKVKLHRARKRLHKELEVLLKHEIESIK